MAASKKFTPRASSNLIEEGVADETVNTVDDENVTPTGDIPDAPVVVTPEVTVNDEEPELGENPPENTKDSSDDDSVTFTAKTNKKPIEKMVKIRLAKKYDGCIGGEWYHFAKDQVVTVPENVKRILNKAEGMLKPL